MIYILCALTGAALALGGALLLLLWKRKLRFGHFTLVWSKGQVTRLAPSLGAVYEILSEDGRVLYIDQGSAAIDSLKRDIRLVLTQGAYLTWLLSEVMNHRTIRARVVAIGKTESERRRIIRQLSGQFPNGLELASSTPVPKALNDFIEIVGEASHDAGRTEVTTANTSRHRPPAELRDVPAQGKGLDAFVV